MAVPEAQVCICTWAGHPSQEGHRSWAGWGHGLGTRSSRQGHPGFWTLLGCRDAQARRRETVLRSEGGTSCHPSL